MSWLVLSSKNGIHTSLQIFRISDFEVSNSGRQTLHSFGSRWWVSTSCIFRNPLIQAPRIKFKNVDSILSFKWWPRKIYEAFVNFCSDENWEYLRFLSEFSSSFHQFLSYRWKSKPEKNSDINFASSSLSGLILWLQCAIWTLFKFNPLIWK